MGKFSITFNNYFLEKLLCAIDLASSLVKYGEKGVTCKAKVCLKLMFNLLLCRKYVDMDGINLAQHVV
jgi:hypothetical protein